MWFLKGHGQTSQSWNLPCKDKFSVLALNLWILTVDASCLSVCQRLFFQDIPWTMSDLSRDNDMGDLWGVSDAYKYSPTYKLKKHLYELIEREGV